jgi:ribosomal protein S18 acetylase RimI-like enzyme
MGLGHFCRTGVDDFYHWGFAPLQAVQKRRVSCSGVGLFGAWGGIDTFVRRQKEISEIGYTIWQKRVSMISQPVYSRKCVVQGLFGRVPDMRPLSVQRTTQAIRKRPGMEAFQVNLTPKSGGWPLPRDVQSKMESALGANFSDVRIHVGPEASAIGAIAFTWGSDIHFAPGQYNPHTPQGQSILGHELAHVVQQRAGRVSNPFGNGVAVVQDHALEAEADRLGHLVATSRPRDVEPSVTSGFSGTTPHAARDAVISRKVAPATSYSVGAPQPNGAGWQIQVAAQGASQTVASVQLTPSEYGVYISNLRVAPEHRRHGLGGQLIDAALRTARSRGFPVAQLEARPESTGDVTPAALVSMYRKLGFCTTRISERGNPFMERRT